MRRDGAGGGAGPRGDRVLLAVGGRLVPAADRDEWCRLWEAELWHRRNPQPRPHGRTRTGWATADLATGLVRDALWLRVEGWNRLLRGTAALALLWLLSSCALAAALGDRLLGGSHPLALRLQEVFPRAALAAVLVSFVTLAVAQRRPVDQVARGGTGAWLRRQAFLLCKIGLLLLLMLLLSLDGTEPMRAAFPATTDFLEILSFVLLSLVGLRWALDDQGQRCQQCLRRLGAPARVGRPSRNLLEWNGTELACTRGHGRLTIPELETSWCERSAWVLRTALGDESAST